MSWCAAEALASARSRGFSTATSCHPREGDVIEIGSSSSASHANSEGPGGCSLSEWSFPSPVSRTTARIRAFGEVHPGSKVLGRHASEMPWDLPAQLRATAEQSPPAGHIRDQYSPWPQPISEGAEGSDDCMGSPSPPPLRQRLANQLRFTRHQPTSAAAPEQGMSHCPESMTPVPKTQFFGQPAMSGGHGRRDRETSLWDVQSRACSDQDSADPQCALDARPADLVSGERRPDGEVISLISP